MNNSTLVTVVIKLGSVGTVNRSGATWNAWSIFLSSGVKSFDQQPDSYSHRYTICPVQPVLFYRPVQQLDGDQRSNRSFDSSYKVELNPQKEKVCDVSKNICFVFQQIIHENMWHIGWLLVFSCCCYGHNCCKQNFRKYQKSVSMTRTDGKLQSRKHYLLEILT